MLSDIKHLWRSFAGGEIAEEMFGRLDLPAYNTGLALCKNFRPLPTGPIENRAGTQFAHEVKDSSKSTRLIPFIRGNGQALVLEFGDKYIRFHAYGGTVYDVSGGQTIADMTEGNGQTTFTVAAHGFSVGDEVIFGGVLRDGEAVAENGQIFKVDFATTNSFTLTSLTGTHLRLTPDGTGTLTGGTVDLLTNVSPYEVTSPYAGADLFRLKFAQDVDTLTITHPSYDKRELVRVADDNWTLSAIDLSVSFSGPASATAVIDGPIAGSDPRRYNYAVTAVVNGEESADGAKDGENNTLWNAGNRNKITCDSVSGADFYNVYKSEEGGTGGNNARSYGFIGSMTDPSVGLLDHNISPDFSQHPPVDLTSGLDTSNNYPSAVAYYQQRRIFANTNNEPQNFWATNAGQPDLLTKTGTPPNDSDGFTFKLSSLRANAIRHIVGLRDLLFFTGGNVYRAFSAVGEGLSARTIQAVPDMNIGATHVQPVEANDTVLFANATGEHLISANYSNEAGGYRDTDLSVAAPHLIDGRRWVQFGFQTAPVQTFWGVRSDGKLIGLTFLVREKVIAWHQHEIAGGSADDYGEVESLAVVPEGTEDVVYLIVKRTINGNTKRYIEFIHTRRFDTIDEAFFVDGGLTYDGRSNSTAITTVTGLDHLEGETVKVVADGLVLPDETVDGGSITIDQEAELIHIGLGYKAQAKTLPVPYETAALGFGNVVNVNEVVMRVQDTGEGLEAGPDFTDMREMVAPFDQSIGSGPGLRNDIVEIPIDPEWQHDGVCVQQANPLPAKITAMRIDFATGE